MDLPQTRRCRRMMRLVLTTFPDAAQAEKAAHRLVHVCRLAACATLLPGAISIYIWKGALEKNQECLLLLKTTADCVETLQVELRKIHPYEVPEILSFEADSCLPAYAEWVAQQCGPEKGAE